MKVESLAVAAVRGEPERAPAERVERERRQAQESTESPGEKSKVQAEELLGKIKELTEDGTYSVRFEMDDKVDRLVIRLVDAHTGEEIRQVPAEEVLNGLQVMRNLRGNIIDVAS